MKPVKASYRPSQNCTSRTVQLSPTDSDATLQTERLASFVRRRVMIMWSCAGEELLDMTLAFWLCPALLLLKEGAS